MLLQYADADSTAILATLDDDETLGHQRGPATFTVPVAPGNIDFDDLNSRGLAIGAFVAIPNFPDIDPRQFYQALAMDTKITQAECLAYLKTGALPSSVQTAVNSLPNDQQFAALCLLIGAQHYERAHPFVTVLGTAMGMQSQDLDALWIAAAAL